MYPENIEATDNSSQCTPGKVNECRIFSAETYLNELLLLNIEYRWKTLAGTSLLLDSFCVAQGLLNSAGA